MKGMGSYSKPGPRRVKGRGGYAEDIGGSIGNWLGKKAGGLFSSMFGLGSYTVKSNSLSTSPNDPAMVVNTTSGTRIQHREYIKDIRGSIAFEIETFPIQPGISRTFPWLASIANAFEEYRLHGILFEFKSTSADALNSTNTALGTVIMATEYNPLHGPFTAKRDMENYVYSTSSPPSLSALHPVECARDVTVLDELFVRNSPLTGADLRFSDVGLFQIATVGMQAAAVIGELWVTYDIELLKPKLPDAFTTVAPMHFAYNATLPTVPSPTYGSPTYSDLFGAPLNQKLAHLGTGVVSVDLSNNTIRFRELGRYLLIQSITNFTTPFTSPGLALLPGSGISLVNIIYNVGATSEVTAPVSGVATSKQVMDMFVIDVNEADSPNSDLEISWDGPSFSGLDSYNLWIIPLPAGFSQKPISDIESLQQQLLALTGKFNKMLDEKEREEDLYVEARDESLPTTRPSTTGTPVDLSASTINLAKLIKHQFSSLP